MRLVFLAMSALVQTSCAPSVSYVSQPKPLPPLPEFVTTTAKAPVVKVPAAGAPVEKQRRFVKDLRLSELARDRALKAAVERYNAVRDKLKETQ